MAILSWPFVNAQVLSYISIITESEDVSVVEIEDLIKQLIKEDSLTDFYATIPSAPAEGQGSVPAGQLEEYLNEVTTRLSPSKLKVNKMRSIITRPVSYEILPKDPPQLGGDIFCGFNLAMFV